MTRTFTRNELRNMGLPYASPEGGEIVSDVIVGHRRWEVDHELTFRLASQPAGEAWLVSYSVGATETQDQRPWEYESAIEARLVRAVEKMVTVWEEI